MKNISFLSFLLIFGLAINTTTSSCTPDTEIVTVVETDTLIVTQVDTLITVVTDTLVMTELLNDTATTFILVRHAEKMDVGTDPSLTPEGQSRAMELSRILENISLSAVYSSDFNRTRETAQPVADSQSLTLQLYNPSNLNSFTDDALADYPAEKILVVGHSNTTPDLLNILVGEERYTNIPETEHDNLYLVTIFEKGRAEVHHMKYGD